MMQRPSDELRERVLEEIARTPSPTRRAWQRSGWVLAGLAGAVLIGTLAGMGIPDGAMVRPLPYVATAVGCALLLALLATRSMGKRASVSQDAEPSLRRVAVLTPVGLGLGALLANAAAPATWSWPSPSISAHTMCLWMDSLLSVMLLGLASFWLRGSDPWSPKARGAVAGAAIGAWVMLFMAVRCPQTDPVHVLATHVIPVALTVVLGRWLGGRYFAPGSTF